MLARIKNANSTILPEFRNLVTDESLKKRQTERLFDPRLKENLSGKSSKKDK